LLCVLLGCETAVRPDVAARGRDDADPPPASAAAHFDYGDLRNGDIVFQTSRSRQSEAVQAATRSAYSHMGIVYVDADGPKVFEASRTVVLTPIEAWARRGEDGRIVVKRLEDGGPLTDETLRNMKSVGEAFAGKRYDLAFAWDDDRMYCSELVHKIYDRGAGIALGDLEKLGDFDLDDPAVARIVRERFGGDVPVDETVISPQSMFDDAKLVTVFDGVVGGG
jgi:hypothetical protein